MIRVLLPCLVAAMALQTPPSAERSILAAVDAGNQAALRLLEKVVNINSGTHNFPGVRAVGDVLRQEFTALGFTTMWVDGIAFHRAGHLIANHPGPGPRVILVGHLDTVFESDSPFQAFKRIDDKTATGPGVIDMKGGDVIIVSALKALKAAGVLDRLNVIVAMTGDEEDAGDPQPAARAALVQAAQGARYALGFEDGPGDPKFAVTARRGTSTWKLEIKAKAGHSSQIFRSDIGYGANYEMARILDGFRRRLAAEPHLTLNPSLVLGGSAADLDEPLARGVAAGKTNVIPERAVVIGDLRTLSNQQLEHARAVMKSVVSTTRLAKAEATITFADGYPGLPPTPGNAKLLGEYDRVSRELGFGPVTAVSPDRAGAADVAFISDQVSSIIDGIGLMGRDDHSPQETADLTTLPSQTKRAAILLYRLTQGID
jgi:glutamate carboxypeptidase